MVEFWPGHVSLMTRIVAFIAVLVAPGPAGAETQYRLSPGDTIAINVFEEADLSFQSIRIPSSGAISYPLIGEVPVAGLTVQELENRIRDLLLQGYLLKPIVTVSVLEYRPVYVGGSVNNPGEHRYSVGMSVEKAVAVAGGYVEDADSAAITIYREAENPSPYQVDLSYEVEPGDVITVPAIPKSSQTQTSYVYLYGQVRNPGSYEYRIGLTVEKAVALAGGFGPRASKRKIEITREGDPKLKISGAKLIDDVKPGDVITVGASFF